MDLSHYVYIYIYLFCEKVQFFVTQNLYDNYRIIVLCDYTLMNRFLCGNICEEYIFFSQIPAFLIITISIILHEILKYYKLIFYFLPLPQYIVPQYFAASALVHNGNPLIHPFFFLLLINTGVHTERYRRNTDLQRSEQGGA